MLSTHLAQFTSFLPTSFCFAFPMFVDTSCIGRLICVTLYMSTIAYTVKNMPNTFMSATPEKTKVPVFRGISETPWRPDPKSSPQPEGLDSAISNPSTRKMSSVRQEDLIPWLLSKKRITSKESTPGHSSVPVWLWSITQRPSFRLLVRPRETVTALTSSYSHSEEQLINAEELRTQICFQHTKNINT